MKHNIFERYLANKVIVVSIIIFFALVIYYDAINHEFIIFDDQVYLEAIISNDSGLWSLVKFAFTSIVNSNWHPVTMVSLIIDYKIFGDNPGGYHITSVFLHVLNSFFVYLIFRLLTKNCIRSFLIATIFLLHPINVEVVAWIAERKGVIGAFFSLASIYAFINYRIRGKRKDYIICTFLFLAALMSKAVFVTLPILFFVIDIYLATINKIDLKRFYLLSIMKTQAPLLGVSLFFGVVTILAHTHSGALGAVEYVSWGARIAKAIAFTPVYLLQLLYPANLAIPYPYRVPSITTVLASLTIVTTLTVLALVFRKRLPYLFLGWFWYLVLLVPVSGVLQSGFHAHADRYAYLPLIGIIFFLVFFISEIIWRFHIKKYILAIIFLVLIATLTASSWIQYKYWKNSFTLFYNTYTIDQQNYMANTLLSGLYIQSGNFDNGMQFYRQARDSEPTYLRLYDKISDAFILNNKPDLAVSVLNDSLVVYSYLSDQYGPKYEHLRHKNIQKIAKIHISQKKYNEAALVLDKISEINSDDPELQYLYGHINYGIGDYELAETFFENYLIYSADHYQANYLLILVYIKLKKIEMAQTAIDSALKKFPNKKAELRQLLELIN